MADEGNQEGAGLFRGDIKAEDWEIGKCDVTLEEDGIRMTVELLPVAEGATATTMEFFHRPF
jgi:hypothetical protein